ncbi:MAG: type II toxin-antitoxin system VapC family toxin [Acidobacteriota bacterium]
MMNNVGSNSAPMYLLDTNILVYAADQESLFHQETRSFRDEAVHGRVSACVSPTVLKEFYAIVTDSKRVRNPLSPANALQEVQAYRQALKVIYPSSAAMDRLKELIDRYPVKGQEIFDVFLVATMLEHGVGTIYTANVRHFEKFKEIRVKSPGK